MQNVKILTNDGVEHVADADFIGKYFKTLENTIDDVGDYEAPIPVPNLNSTYFRKIVEYTKLAIQIEKAKNESDGKENNESNDKVVKSVRESVSELETEFYNQIHKDIELSKVQLKDFLTAILNGCDYLENEVLLDLMCKMSARMIAGKSPEELRKMFSLPDDLTEDEKKDIHEHFTL